jgi:hypothetical protein
MNEHGYKHQQTRHPPHQFSLNTSNLNDLPDQDVHWVTATTATTATTRKPTVSHPIVQTTAPCTCLRRVEAFRSVRHVLPSVGGVVN